MADNTGNKDKGTMMFIVSALLLTLVGAGTGFSVGSLLHATPGSPGPASALGTTDSNAGHDPLPENNGPPAGHGTAEEQHGGGEAGAGQDGHEEVGHVAVKAVPFPPVLTTLAAPQGKWIRLEGSALIKLDAEDSPELLAEKAGEQILTYLRTVRLDQIEGPSGTLGLREDLNETVRVLSHEQVQGILIHALLIE